MYLFDVVAFSYTQQSCAIPMRFLCDSCAILASFVGVCLCACVLVCEERRQVGEAWRKEWVRTKGSGEQVEIQAGAQAGVQVFFWFFDFFFGFPLILFSKTRPIHIQLQ